MNRAILPNRRPNSTIMTEWEGHEIAVTVGYDPATADPREVFANTPRGGALQGTVADACVVISIALQHGVSPEALSRSLGRVPVWPEPMTAPASPIGAIMAIVVGEAK